VPIVPKLALAAPILLAVCLSKDALAWRCTAVPNTPAPLTQAWDQRCIPYWINDSSAILSGQDRRDLVAQCFRTWSGDACTDLQFLDSGYASDQPGFDQHNPGANKNVIIAVEDPGKINLFSDPNLIALTLTSFSVDSGEIFDADIMLNAVRFKFVDVTDQKACEAMRMDPQGPYDLRNTLTHEMGHFIGFDHDPDIHSTMFASAQPCETMKRMLSAADQQGVCTVYPASQPTHTCQPPASGYDSVDGASSFRDQCARAEGLSTASRGCTSVQVHADTDPRRASYTGIAIAWLLVSAVVTARRRRAT
jgi:hypothetical protein